MLKIFILLILSFKLQATIVPNYKHHFSEEKSDWDNGYKKERYHFVLNSFIKIWSPIIKEKYQGTFQIERDWSDGAVNAWAWRSGNSYRLEVPGGMARYYLINEEAFLLVLCHELGHLIGGRPRRGKISYEGQADYFAHQKCMRKVLPHMMPLRKAKEVISSDRLKEIEGTCKDHHDDFCTLGLKAGISLTSYFASLTGKEFPRLGTPASTIVKETLTAHPPAQCRLDTYFASVNCRKDYSSLPPISKYGQNIFCKKSEDEKGFRPNCWYAN